MLTFSITLVRDVIARGLKDAEANGGFRDPYYGLKPGEGERPGVWLVGDEGVYLMSNGTLAEGEAARGLRAGVRSKDQCRLVPRQAPASWRR